MHSTTLACRYDQYNGHHKRTCHSKKAQGSAAPGMLFCQRLLARLELCRHGSLSPRRLLSRARSLLHQMLAMMLQLLLGVQLLAVPSVPSKLAPWAAWQLVSALPLKECVHLEAPDTLTATVTTV